MTTPSIDNELDAHYLLGDEQIARFEEQGFIKLKNVFSQEVLDYYGKVITASVIANNDLADVPPNHDRDLHGRTNETEVSGEPESATRSGGVVSRCRCWRGRGFPA